MNVTIVSAVILSHGLRNHHKKLLKKIIESAMIIFLRKTCEESRY